MFVDVRGDELYNTGHIPGALSIADTEMDSRFTELDPNAWIILYCTWPAEESSARAATVLLARGFTNVSALKGGLQLWQQTGYPME